MSDVSFSLERIVLAIDLEKEMASTEYDPAGDDAVNPLTRLLVLKESLTMFVQAKLSMHPGHQFAICVLLPENKIEWRLDWSSDRDAILKIITQLDVVNDYFTTFGVLIRILVIFSSHSY